MTSSRCVKKHLLAFSICTALSLNTAAIAAAQESISIELDFRLQLRIVVRAIESLVPVYLN